MHELACVSGIAAAYRLGAEYAKFDDFAEDFFSKVSACFSWGEVWSGAEETESEAETSIDFRIFLV